MGAGQRQVEESMRGTQQHGGAGLAERVRGARGEQGGGDGDETVQRRRGAVPAQRARSTACSSSGTEGEEREGKRGATTEMILSGGGGRSGTR